MKRNKFLGTVATLGVLPTFSFSKALEFFLRKDKGFKISAGEGRIHGHIQLKGVNSYILDVKISGKDTDGTLAIFEQTSLSQGKFFTLEIKKPKSSIGTSWS